MQPTPKNSQHHWILWTVILLLSTIDLVLLERKYNIFTGGFLQTHSLTTWQARIFFSAITLALEASMAGCIWYAFLLFGSWRQTPTPVSKYQFLFIYGVGSIALMAAKYEIISYFGDFLSLAILRNLGGGSITAALLYGLQEGAIFAAACSAGFMLCWWVYRQLRQRQQSIWAQVPPTQSHGLLVSKMLGCLAILLVVTLGARSEGNKLPHLSKITPYSLATQAITPWLASSVSAHQQLLQLAPHPAATPTLTYQIDFPEKKENLVLIISESTRADVLHATVDGKDATPIWNALAAQGSVAKNYYSHTGFTTSSLKAIFRASLGPQLPLGGTLFDLLKKQGYQIVVLSGQDESFGNIANAIDATQTADIFFDGRSDKEARVFASSAPSSLKLSNARIVQEFEKITPKIDWQRPVFIYINFQAAHFPYYDPQMPLTLIDQPLERRQISAERAADLRRTYLNAVASSDASTGRIVQQLQRLGVAQRTLLAVSGDHGESLFDDGILGHGVSITEAQLHTLLLANRPIAAFERPLGQTDLALALLQGLGVRITPTPASQDKPILALIGDPQSPSSLGYRYPNGQRLSLDFERGELSASWLQAPMALAALPPGSRELQEAQRLAQDWRSLLNL